MTLDEIQALVKEAEETFAGCEKYRADHAEYFQLTDEDRAAGMTERDLECPTCPFQIKLVAAIKILLPPAAAKYYEVLTCTMCKVEFLSLKGGINLCTPCFAKCDPVG